MRGNKLCSNFHFRVIYPQIVRTKLLARRAKPIITIFFWDPGRKLHTWISPQRRPAISKAQNKSVPPKPHVESLGDRSTYTTQQQPPDRQRKLWHALSDCRNRNDLLTSCIPPKFLSHRSAHTNNFHAIWLKWPAAQSKIKRNWSKNIQLWHVWSHLWT